MAAAPGTFDYFRRGGIYPNGNTKTALDYYRRGEPIVTMGADASTSSFSATASGGLVAANSATVQVRYSYLPTGRITTGNSVSQKITLTTLASGNIVLAGTVSTSLRQIATPSGGAVLGNSVIVVPRYLYIGSGDPVASGTATIVFVAGTYLYTASAGTTLAGTATTQPRYLYAASAGMVMAGDAAEKPVYTSLAVGNSVLAGTSAISPRYIYLPSSGMTLAGSATVSSNISFFSYTASGNVRAGGSATTSYVINTMSVQYQASGGIAFGGTADLRSSRWNYAARFGQFGVNAFVTGGAAANVKSSNWIYNASGGAETDNQAVVKSSYWEYMARFGQFGESAFQFTGGTAEALTSYHSYLAQFGSFGASALQFSQSTAPAAKENWSFVASGKFIASGVSDQKVYRVIPQTSARIRTGNSATASNPKEFDASGGQVLAGTAVVTFSPILIGSGGLGISGSSDLHVTRATYVAVGTVRTGNAAQIVRNASASGVAKFSGAAHVACSYWSYQAVPTSLGLYAPSYYELITHQNPLGFWVLDETGPTVVGPFDTLPNYGSSGAGSYAILEGSPVFQQESWIPNQRDGYSMRFDWINTLARVSAGPDIIGDSTTARSISMVFRLYDTTMRSCLYDEGSSVTGLNLYVVNDKLVFHIWDIDPPALDSASLIVSINDNQNYHVTATADIISNTMKLYLDGVLVGAQQIYATPKTSMPERNGLSFGAKADGTRYNDTNGGFFTSSSSPGTGQWTRGYVQAVAIWDRVLSQTEVSLQQNARAARYTSTSENVYFYTPSGSISVGGAATTTSQSGLWSYTASGKMLTTGTSTAVLPTLFVVLGTGGIQAGSNALVVYNRFDWLAASGPIFSAQQSLSKIGLALATGGNGVLAGSANVISSRYSYTASGGINTAVTFTVGTFTLTHSASGNMVLASTASALLSQTYNATGGMVMVPFAKFDYTLEVERDITWNISRGVLRYYRVEGKPRPAICPPVSGICGSDQCVQYVVNVSAHSVGEVCDQLRKLRFKGPVKRISVQSRPVLKTDEDPAVNYDCNTFVDVAIPLCDDLFLDYDLLVTAGATPITVITEDFAYFPSGLIRSSGEADKIFDKWSYIASGAISAANEATVYFAGKVFVTTSGGAVLGGTSTYSTNALGTQLVTAGATPMALFTEVVFGSQAGGVLLPPDETVASLCCGNLPSLLYMNHQMERFAKLDKFLFINDLSLRRNLRLVYSAKRNTWYNNIHFKGTGSNNDPETWDITSEFGCVDDLDGIPIQGTLWGFSYTVCNRNLRTKSDNYTRIVLGFDPTLVCTLDEAIDNTFTINVRDQSTNPVVLRAVVLYDEIGLFKNRAFINDPSIQFRVTSTPLTSPLSNINLSNSLQEILL